RRTRRRWCARRPSARCTPSPCCTRRPRAPTCLCCTPPRAIPHTPACRWRPCAPSRTCCFGTAPPRCCPTSLRPLSATTARGVR
ncbi:unnamed protein product, partial [Closterium sp. NIES-53]